jgi:hypothetical protein
METLIETESGIRTNVASYTELATGLHYWDGQEYRDSEDLIEPALGGAAAVRGPHVVWFNESLTAGAISVTTPDGKAIRSHPLAVAYADGARTVFIAQLQEAEGWLHASHWPE